MVRDNTVLVIGAGGSMPFGYPSGRQLVAQIVEGISFGFRGENVEPLNRFARCLLSAGCCPEELRNFKDALNRSQTYSVDAFLERHPDFIRVGKIAIAAALIPKEIPEKLLSQDDNWYRYLANRLLDNISANKRGNLTIITYNYDRSLDYYLYETLQAAMNYSQEEMKLLMGSLKIIHVHGSFGMLPWQEPLEGTSARPYGKQDDVANAANNIQIIHESIDDSPAYEEARSYLRSANRVIFLGFGFHRTNVRRLRAGGWLSDGQRGPLVGTCYQLRSGEKNHCLELFRGMIELEDLECHEFLRYRLELIS